MKTFEFHLCFDKLGRGDLDLGDINLKVTNLESSMYWL